MNADPTQSSDRLEEAVAEYLKAIDAGQPPDRDVWLRRYPDLADELPAFFADQASFARLAGPVRHGEAPGISVRYLGDYELLDEIARVGMGVVWKARQVSLNRVVALKMILAGQLASAAEVERFL